MYIKTVILVGFIEYARSIFFEKDPLKTKLLIDSEIEYPQLIQDQKGFIVKIPEPKINEEHISFLGYNFPNDTYGKLQCARLFRAAVFHLGAHVVSSKEEEYSKWRGGREPRLARFTETLIKDVEANAYVSAWYPDKLVDLAFANSLALERMRDLERINNRATKVMVALLIYANMGLTKTPVREEQDAIERLVGSLEQFKNKVLFSFVDDEKSDLLDTKMKLAQAIYDTVENSGPIIEFPSLPHTECLGHCSLFPPYKIRSEENKETQLTECLTALGGSLPTSADQSWKKIAEAEALQVFDSWMRQKEKQRKILSKYEEFLFYTRFKSVDFPQEDYTEYLKARSRCKSEAHRLIESLLVARDALDEDPRKMYGVLDLQEVIQVIASKSPRMDVFMLDENISKSYAWVILLDASRSMRNVRDHALDICVILAEAAKELLIDPTSWAMYAFNDRFFIIKDPRERYNIRVKSRIGGIKFDGFTYLPDALEIAGQIMKKRSENLRLITVISDGWPYGYPNIALALTESVEALERAQITVIGIGANSRKVENFFQLNCIVYTLRDLTKQFSNLYLEASRVAVGV